MARKISNTIEFFQHYANKQSRTVAKLESKYGNDGYAFLFRLLEILAATENHYLDLSEPADMDYFAARMRIEPDTCEKIISDLVNWKKIDRQLWEQNRGVWYEQFVNNHSHVYEKRKRQLPTRPVISGTEMQAEPDSCHRNTTTPRISVPESTHSIVEYRIGENSIVQDISFKKRNKRFEVFRRNRLTKISPNHKAWLAKRKSKKASHTGGAAETVPNYFEMFSSIQKIFPGTKRSPETEWKDFEKKYKKEFSVEFFRAIYRGIQSKKKYHAHLQNIKAEFIPSWPHFRTYLNQRKWEEQTDLTQISQANGSTINTNRQSANGAGADLETAVAMSRLLVSDGYKQAG